MECTGDWHLGKAKVGCVFSRSYVAKSVQFWDFQVRAGLGQFGAPTCRDFPATFAGDILALANGKHAAETVRRHMIQTHHSEIVKR